MLALRGLFVLMTRHDLEYPRFYPLLYALITPFALNGTHRVVFIAHLQACGRTPGNARPHPWQRPRFSCHVALSPRPRLLPPSRRSSSSPPAASQTISSPRLPSAWGGSRLPLRRQRLCSRWVSSTTCCCSTRRCASSFTAGPTRRSLRRPRARRRRPPPTRSSRARTTLLRAARSTPAYGKSTRCARTCARQPPRSPRSSVPQ